MLEIRKWVRFSLKLLIALGISFVLIELFLLACNDLVFSRVLYVFDRDLGFRVRSYGSWGSFRANRFGFNDRDYSLERTPETTRILLLSDSFNWAGGLEENYTAILERLFEEEFGNRQVEVINAGYSSTHTYEQLLLLQKFGLQYNPDLVILGFVAGNDFIDAQPWRKRIVFGGTFLDIDTRHQDYLEILGQPLLLKSRFYRYLRDRWTVLRSQTEAQQEGNTEVGSQAATMPNDSYLLLGFSRMQFANLDKEADFAPHRQHILEGLTRMQELLANRGIDFMVASFPDEFQVDPALRQAIIARYQMDPSKYRWNQAQVLLRDFCEGRSVEFYDLLPEFQGAHQMGQRLYLPNDSHWNSAGNQLAARLLFEILVEKMR